MRHGTAGTTGGDMYFELGYAFKYFGIYLGAGDGWHTEDGEFCNMQHRHLFFQGYKDHRKLFPAGKRSTYMESGKRGVSCCSRRIILKQYNHEKN